MIKYPFPMEPEAAALIYATALYLVANFDSDRNQLEEVLKKSVDMCHFHNHYLMACDAKQLSDQERTRIMNEAVDRMDQLLRTMDHETAKREYFAEKTLNQITPDNE